MHFKHIKNGSFANVHIAGASTGTVPHKITAHRNPIWDTFKRKILCSLFLVTNLIFVVIKRWQQNRHNHKMNTIRQWTNPNDSLWITMTVRKTDKLWWRWNSQRRMQKIRVVADDEKGQIGAGIAIKIFRNNILRIFIEMPFTFDWFLWFGSLVRQQHDCDENQNCKYERDSSLWDFSCFLFQWRES